MAGFSRMVCHGNPFVCDAGRTNAHRRSPATPAQDRDALVSASAAMDFTGYRQRPATMPTGTPAPVSVVPRMFASLPEGALDHGCPSVAAGAVAAPLGRQADATGPDSSLATPFGDPHRGLARFVVAPAPARADGPGSAGLPA